MQYETFPLFFFLFFLIITDASYRGACAPKNISRDSKDTRADSYRVRDQPWSFQGPYRDPKKDGPGPYNFQAYFRVSIPFLYWTLSSPSHHFGTLFWSLWNSIRAQWTLLDLHGPQNGPQNGPCEANFS